MENERETDTPGMHLLTSAPPMTNAERIAMWEREGVFETFAYLNDLIGPGKLYADSTEYLHARRAQIAQLERE